MLGKRIISALAALPLLFAAVIFNLNVFFAALFIITAIGLYEYFTAVESGGVKPMRNIGIIMGLLVLVYIFNQNGLISFVLLMTLIILILLSIPIFSEKYNFYGVGVTIIGIFYIPLFLGFIYLIRAIPDKGLYLVWFVFIASWLTDTFAYFAGTMFGKTKLCPSISPKKTVEGAIGGIIGSILGCIIYGLIIDKVTVVHISVIHLFIMGLLGGIISQIGDLAASSIKRNVGIKDYGKIMPGHGGVLDRFDSILFVAPLIYYYITYVL
jgi:phosphatidate cytidylyltransferase